MGTIAYISDEMNNPGRKRQWEIGLKIHGWTSEYKSVQNLLNHLVRKGKYPSSRQNFSFVLYQFLRDGCSGISPDELVLKTPVEAQSLLQAHLDAMAARGVARRTVNTRGQFLLTFFRSNGFKKDREIEIESYHINARTRTNEEYIPTKEEVWKMADSCGSSLVGMRDKAMILGIFGTGFRSGTFRAIRYKDILKEIEKWDGESWIYVPCYPEMKQTVATACKNNIPYYAFLFPEAVRATLDYFKLRNEAFGQINSEDPVFCSFDKRLKGHGSHPISENQLGTLVANAAKRAGVEKWNDVYPHCIRKSFESIVISERTDRTRIETKTGEFFMGHLLPGAQDTYFDKTKIEAMRVEFSLLNFARDESKGLKSVKQSLEQAEKTIAELNRRQTVWQSFVLDQLVKGQLKEAPLEMLEKAGYEIIKNPDASFSLKLKTS